MNVATSRYQSADLIVASGLAPVGTTVGRPRFKLGYELAGYCGKIAPYGLFGKGLSPAEFDVGYRARLEKFGVDEITATLDELRAKHGSSKGVVLLCYEDVHAGEHCHRRTFADWWLEQTGQHVEEL
jgi:hypothetical protein